MLTYRLSSIVALAAGLALTAPVTAQEVEQGAVLFANHCAACHGRSAEGDGPKAGVLTIQPPNLTRLSARHDGVFPLDRVTRRIDGRDPLTSHGSPMPVYGHLFDDQARADQAAQSPDDPASDPIQDLIAYLRSIQN